jgi:hypothetical protein
VLRLARARDALIVALGLLVAGGAACGKAVASSPVTYVVGGTPVTYTPGLTPVTINVDCQNDIVLETGDSWDEGQGNEPGFGTGMWYPIPVAVSARQAAIWSATNPPASFGRTVALSRALRWKQNGKSGTGISDLAANVATRVVAYAPTVILWHLSSNDWGIAEATWDADATTFANAVDAGTSAKVYVISNLVAANGAGEQWTVAGWPSGGTNTNVEALNAQALRWIAGRNPARWVYVNLRGTATSDTSTVLQFEANNNLPAPGASLYTILGADQHPIRSSGQQVLAGIFIKWFSFSNL